MSNITNFLRNKVVNKQLSNLSIQMVEYHEKDLCDFENKIMHTYQILMFGITSDNISVCVKVNNFKPFFYIEVPDTFSSRNLLDFKEMLEEQEYQNASGDAKKYKYALTDSEFDLSSNYKCDGFQSKQTKFLKISFKSLFGYYKLKNYFFEFIKKMKKITFDGMSWIPRLYESDISPLLRFFHDRDIKTCGWVNLRNNILEPVEKRISFCQYECTVEYVDVEPSTNETIGPLTIASFDIECTSGDGSFPCADREEDRLIQIGTTFEKYNQPDVYYNTIITLGGCSDIKDAEVISCETELELFYEWMCLIKKIDPDIITGYNINGFDYKYMWDRLEYLESDSKKRNKMMELGRLKEPVKLVTKNLDSSALGQNILNYFDIPGRVNMDLYGYVKREFKLDSYKLDSVSKKFLNNKKDDISPQDIFRLQKGSDDDRMLVAKYCIQDCRLCNKLVSKLSVIENTFGMASTCYIPINYIFFRGQGIKGHSLVVKHAAELGYIIPSSRIEAVNSDYKGATVIDPNTGSHFYPVTCLDFNSLYPSCMISHNLCITSIITDDKDLNIPGRTYKTISWIDDDTGKEKKYTYIQPKNEDSRALLPTILQLLLKKRADTRVKQAEFSKTDPFKANILNGLQLSYKITANSIYGLLGARTSAISRPEIAACITTTGRAMLDIAREGVEKHFRGSKIIYGDTDSIFVRFELRNHCEDCEFHSSKIDERFNKLEFFVNKYVKIIEDEIASGADVKIKHSIQETAMQRSVYQLYKECKCEIFPDLMSKEALQQSIIYGQQSERLFSFLLPYPHNLAYEKTYLPYISFAKKRYIGYLYETNVNKFKLDSKGIVLKRRDNAPIVKKLYNGSIEHIMKGDFKSSLEYIKTEIKKIFNNEYELENFTITKTLKSLESYKISFMKKKFMIQGAINTFELCFLLKDLSLNDMNTLLKILKYTGGEEKINSLIVKNKINFIQAILLEEKLRTSVETLNMSKLLKDKSIELRKKIHYSEFREIIESSEMDIKLFKNVSSLDGEVDIQDFMKNYKELYTSLFKQKVSQSHVALNEKLKLRDLGSAYQVNDRIPYCFIKTTDTKTKKALQSDIVEVPSYIKENPKIKLDYIYYLEKQLSKPLTQLYETIGKDKELNDIFNSYIVEEDNKKNKRKNITDMFSKLKK